MLNITISVAPFLNDAAGKKFTEKLRGEIVADVSKLDPLLSTYV